MWESPALKAAEKAVAETYARHARDKEGNKSATADLAWLTYERLMEKAGIGRRAGVSTAVIRLVDLGWLKPVQQVSRRATVYRLTIPVGGSSDGGTTEADEPSEPGSSDGGTTVVPLSVSGSSTLPSGSSDGGTQPLGPSKELTTRSISLSAREVEASASTVVAAEPEREIVEASPEPKNDNPVSRLLLGAGCPADQIDEVREELTRKFAPRSNEWWRKVAREGDLPGLVDEVLEALNPAPEEPVPGAHLFNADSSGISCQQCGRPVQNQIHKVGNQGGGYLAQRSGTDRNQKRSTGVQRMEQALSVADDLDRQFGHGRYADQSRASPGATFGPKGYLHLVDSNHPDRDYTEKF
ncbi:hypothetical protein ACWKSP_22095 [Micromonosporaceae bacterium Da 78-11]